MSAREPRRVPAALAAAAALALGVSGCANVPSGGRVMSGKPAARDEQADDPYVRLVPLPPRNDWTPEQTVAGFLAAASSFDDQHRVARSYLARPTSWNPGDRPAAIVVKDREPPMPVKPEGGGQAGGQQASVRVKGEQLGLINVDGQYVASPKKGFSVTFKLARQPQGGWRVTEMPNDLASGVLLTKSDLERTFRTLDLYFYAPDRRTLVPNGIFLPLANRQQLPEQLVRALLGGPTSWLQGAVTSAFPDRTALNKLTLDKDVVTVDLSKEALSGDPKLMSAQLGWTPRKLSGIRGLRLTIGGKPVAPADGDEPQPLDNDAWSENDPDGPPGELSNQSAYVMGLNGMLSQLSGTGDEPQPVATNAAHRLSRPAVSPDAQEVAGLNGAGSKVLAGALVGSNVRLRTLLTAGGGNRFTAPVFDRDGTLWTVENGKDESVLWSWRRGGKPAKVEQWGLAGRGVKEFRVARDGVRAAAIVNVDGNSQIQLGRILRKPDGSLDVGSFLPLSSELPDAEDLSWRDSGELAVLGRKDPDETVQPYLVPVGGAPIVPLGSGLMGEPKSIAAAPGASVLIGTRTQGDDVVCRQRTPDDRFSEWSCSIPAKDPTYPR